MQRPTEGSPMIKKLQKHGNSRALVIDKAILDALNIGEDDAVQVTVTNGVMTVSPAGVGFGEEAMRESFERLQPRYGKMLENLAK